MSLNLLPTTTLGTPLNGALNYDVSTQVVLYANQQSTGNFQLNFRGDSVTTFASVVPVGSTLSTLLIASNGATPYTLTAVTIDGVAPAEFGWIGRPFPIVGTINDIDQYTINILHASAGVFCVSVGFN